MTTKDDIITAVEEVYGEVFDTEEQCPGVYYLACGPEDRKLGNELLVVERSCPHISDAAKAYGQPFGENLLVYDFNNERSGRDVVLYEAYRYLTLHKLPIPDGNSLLSCAASFSDYYPEYFGMIPAPIQTPHGYLTRYITLANGIFALETDTGARLIAIAGLIWSLELEIDTIPLGEKVAGADAPEELTFLFFSEENGCLALFELLGGYDALLSNERLDKRALMNAVWKYHPDYAISHNLREQRGLNSLLGLALNEAPLHGSTANMVAISPDTDANYICW